MSGTKRAASEATAYSRKTVAGFPYWEVFMWDDNEIEGAAKKAGGNAADKKENYKTLRGAAIEDWEKFNDSPVTDLFVFVHGMNNTRREAEQIYTTYMTRVATIASDHGWKPGTHVGVCGIYWPSRLGLDEKELILPSADLMHGGALAVHLNAILKRKPKLRLHLVAHSLGTVVLTKSLPLLINHKNGKSIGSVFLIQGAAPSTWFTNGMAGMDSKLGGPIIATCSQQDQLMQAVNLAMLSADDQYKKIKVIDTVIKFIGDCTPFKIRESFPDATRLIDETYIAKLIRLQQFTGSSPLSIKGIKGSTAVQMHRAIDDQRNRGGKKYPFSADKAKGLYTLVCDHFISDHNEFKVPDVAFAHLMATSLLQVPKKTPRLPNLMGKKAPNPEKWMEEMWDVLGPRKVNQIVMPGSHDAGASTIKAYYPTFLGNSFIDKAASDVKEKAKQAFAGKRNLWGDIKRLSIDSVEGVYIAGKVVGQVSRRALGSGSGPIDLRGVDGEMANAGKVFFDLFRKLIDIRIHVLSQTQSLSIGEQLKAGARFFDLRPVLHEKTWYLGHVDKNDHLANGTGGAMKYMGVVGEPLDKALKEVMAFVKKNTKEVVFLQFSHMVDLEKQDSTLTKRQLADLHSVIRSALRDHFLRKVGTFAKAMTCAEEMTLQNFITRRMPIVTFFSTDDGGQTTGEFTSGRELGDLKIYDQYSNKPEWENAMSDQKQKFVDWSKNRSGRRGLYLLSWTITLAVAPLTVLFGSIWGSAMGMNLGLMPAMEEWIEEKVITKDNVPNILFMDFIGNAEADVQLMHVIQRLNSLS